MKTGQNCEVCGLPYGRKTPEGKVLCAIHRDFGEAKVTHIDASKEKK